MEVTKVDMKSTGPTRARIRGSFIMAALLSAAATVGVLGCPTQPGCPNCRLKVTNFTVPSPNADGYSVSEATMTSDFTFNGHCPTDDGKDTCEKKEVEELGSIPLDTEVREPLAYEMSSSDTVSITLEVLMVHESLPDVSVTLTDRDMRIEDASG